MLDIKLIREKPELVKENMKKKFMEEDIHLVDDLLKKDTEFRQVLKDVEILRHEKNELNNKINSTKKAGGDITEVLAKAKEIPQKLKELDDKLNSLKIEIINLLKKIPNIMQESVPIGLYR